MGSFSKELASERERHVLISRLKRRILKHLWLTRIGLLIGIILTISIVVFVLIKLLTPGFGNIFSLAYTFVFTPPDATKSFEGRTNILILGKGGEGHTAKDLTDTIILASVSHKKGGVVLISLPRDIWIPELRAKLNSAYYWGNQKQPLIQSPTQRVSIFGKIVSNPQGGGIPLSKATVEEIVGVPVHFAVVIDFAGFTKIIDVVGGIEVDVEREFTDKKYPIEGKEEKECGGDPTFACRYETITFRKGLQKMDGATALKFVRSRNAEGDEGTDFARARRQQKVISALEKKLANPGLVFEPRKVGQIKEVIEESIETDIDQKAGAILARRFFDARGKGMKTFVLPEEFLLNPPISAAYDNQYVFVPRAGDWTEVQFWVRNILAN